MSANWNCDSCLILAETGLVRASFSRGRKDIRGLLLLSSGPEDHFGRTGGGRRSQRILARQIPFKVLLLLP